MLTLHHLDSSRSMRILWLLEELGVPYTLERYQRDARTSLAPPALKAVHPLGKAPVVTDGARTLAESGAICTYLVARHGAGRLQPPPGTDAHDRYTFFMHYAEGSAMPPLLLKLVSRRIRDARVPFFVRPITKRIAAQLDAAFIDKQIMTHFDFVEAELGKGTWLAGDDFSAADIMMSFPIEGALTRTGRADRWPKMAAFLARAKARPAYLRALERGGPFAMLGAAE